jgi:hypothetical protein
MTRLYPEGTPIQVQAAPDGAPLRVLLLEEWRDVRHMANRWRQTSAWWNRDAYVNRELFKIGTADGILATIYHDLETGVWCIHRIYD